MFLKYIMCEYMFGVVDLIFCDKNASFPERIFKNNFSQF